MIKPHERDQGAAQSKDGSAGQVLNASAGLLSFETQQLVEADLRNRVALTGTLDRQRRNDRQRQRNLDLQRGTETWLARDIDGAADLLDVRPNDVHAHAATGHVRDPGRRGEARHEDEIDDLARRHRSQLLDGRQPALDGLRRDPRRVDTRAVVADFDIDLATFMEGAQRQSALDGLTRCCASLGGFNPVVNRIPDQMSQRILDRLKDGLVEFCVAALENEPDLATARDRDVTHEARKLVPDRVDRLHPGLHDPGLELAHQQVQSLGRTLHAGIGAGSGRGDDLIAREHQLADETHEGVEQVHVDPQCRVAHGSTRPRIGLRRRLLCECLAHLVGRGLTVVDQDLAERPGVAELLLEHRHRDVLGVDVGLLLQQLTEQRNVGRWARGRSGGSGTRLACGPSRLDVVLGNLSGRLLARLGRRRGRGRGLSVGRRAGLGVSRPAPWPGRRFRCHRRGGRWRISVRCFRARRRRLGARFGRSAPGCDACAIGDSSAGARQLCLHRRCLQGRESGHQIGVVAVVLDASRLDRGQNAADRVDKFEEAGRPLLGQPQATVAQAREQPFAGMGEDLELAERQEAAGAFDRVNRAENALEQRVGVRFLLERNKVAIELVEILVAFHEELAHDLVELVHTRSSAGWVAFRERSPRCRPATAAGHTTICASALLRNN